MNIRLLSEEDLEQLYKAFKLSFSDNEVRFEPLLEDFNYRLHKKLLINRSISSAAFDGNEMVGFIMHTSNLYEGIPTAYNGGTGVLPGFRNQQTAENMYEFLIPKIQSYFLARVILEVVENNEKAIALYEKIGFLLRRRFRCYKLMKPLEGTYLTTIEEGNINDVDFTFNDFEPSFLDSADHLKRGSEMVLLAKEGDSLLGYLIIQQHLGRISQISIDRIHRYEKVGEALIYQAQKLCKQPLTVMNIPDNETGFDAFLKKCGFENQVNQYEMELII